jgi:serine/threonine-protein kinase
MGAIGETRLEPTQTRQVPSESSGRYRVVGPLSKGGMAELWLALQVGVQGFSRVVALKRVLPSHQEDSQFLEMFLDEARLAARLDHPHIVRIYELGQDGDSYFLAMEFLPGEDLRQLHDVIAAGNLRVTPELAAHLVSRAADALHFAHELTDETGAPLHLVHRDVSPSNVIVTYDGQVKVVDFGIAKAKGNAFHTGANVMKGKLGYLAPEQFTGAPVDRRTDVFGLGILLWELLTNTRLFVRDSAAATMAAASVGEVPALAGFREDVSPELEAIVQHALAHEPAQRFQTAGEMRDALEHYLRTEALPPSTRDVAEWIQSLGGTRRAELKLGIARGANVAASYQELMRLPWDATPAPVVSVGGRRRARPAWQTVLFVLWGIGALALAALATMRAERPPPEPLPLASAQLVSEPPGAFVFVRGEPSGRVTPVTLTGLDPVVPLQFRLEKPGYATLSGELALREGETATRTVTLVANQGLVRFPKLPKGSMVRVAGQVIRSGQQALLPVGRQVAEVLVGGRVVSTHSIVVAPGPQDLTLGGDAP